MLEFVWVERALEALEVALGEPVGSIDEDKAAASAAERPPKPTRNGQAEQRSVA
jgi:hypothetical protein